jgi:hypothetical protein
MFTRLFILFLASIVSISAQTNTLTPTNFVLQVLEPTGGKVLRPKDWFYTESHREKSFVWTLSLEDSSKGKYTTGVAIQTIIDIKARKGKTPKEFIESFIAMKKQTVDKVIKTCSETNQGLFTRVCLETEEGPHRILYSFFWGNKDLDVVVISIAGTKKELWDTYSPVFDRMSGFELIDMKRFEK